MPLDIQARRCMPRQALEVVVTTAAGPLRVVTTHLEYYSPIQRRAQADYLVQCQRQWRVTADRHPGGDSGPFRRFVCPAATLLCGDFNAVEDDPAYRLLVDAEFADVWPLIYGDRPHAPTCGVHDHAQWDQGPHCRDFFFISREFGALRIPHLTVDTATDASDHQPLLLRVTI
jgi:endonuclease/exonuclease/phosphatase family metal-dependent hydrolase